MSKATIISAGDFLKAITAQPVDYALPGVGLVRVRALTAAEGQQLATSGDEEGRLLRALRMGLVEPQLSDDEFAALQQAKAGPVMRLASYIMRLSGMTDDEQMQGEAGGGS